MSLLLWNHGLNPSERSLQHPGQLAMLYCHQRTVTKAPSWGLVNLGLLHSSPTISQRNRCDETLSFTLLQLPICLMRIVTLPSCLLYLDGKLYWAGNSSHQGSYTEWAFQSRGLPAGNTVIWTINNIIHHDLMSGVQIPWTIHAIMDISASIQSSLLNTYERREFRQLRSSNTDVK